MSIETVALQQRYSLPADIRDMPDRVWIGDTDSGTSPDLVWKAIADYNYYPPDGAAAAGYITINPVNEGQSLRVLGIAPIAAVTGTDSEIPLEDHVLQTVYAKCKQYIAREAALAAGTPAEGEAWRNIAGTLRAESMRLIQEGHRTERAMPLMSTTRIPF